jgi:hypothetical protein
MLPVLVSKNAEGQPEFRFHVLGSNEERAYRLMQTVVRRIRSEGEEKKSARSARGDR